MKIQRSGISVANPAASEEVRTFLDGSVRSVARLRSAAVGLGTYGPGWRWSLHAGPQTGKAAEKHIGYILSGRMRIKEASGAETEVGPGEAFEVGPGADAWVVGTEPCVALDFIPAAGSAAERHAAAEDAAPDERGENL